jgi:hypothetical protein
MSSIDKDDKSKVSKPSDKKFFLGFSDAYPFKTVPEFIAILSQAVRRKR